MPGVNRMECKIGTRMVKLIPHMVPPTWLGMMRVPVEYGPPLNHPSTETRHEPPGDRPPIRKSGSQGRLTTGSRSSVWGEKPRYYEPTCHFYIRSRLRSYSNICTSLLALVHSGNSPNSVPLCSTVPSLSIFLRLN